MAYANATQTRPEEVVPALWKATIQEAVRRCTGGLYGFRQAQILFPVVRQLAPASEYPTEAGSGEVAPHEEGEGITALARCLLRILRREVEAVPKWQDELGCASCQWGLERQLDGESSGTLPCLPQLLARAAQEAWDSHGWADAPGYPLLARGVPRRVAKLRALGNAVVPQCAEYVGRCILSFLDRKSLAGVE